MRQHWFHTGTTQSLVDRGPMYDEWRLATRCAFEMLRNLDFEAHLGWNLGARILQQPGCVLFAEAGSGYDADARRVQRLLNHLDAQYVRDIMGDGLQTRKTDASGAHEHL